MKTESFNSEVEMSTLQFIDIFNHISMRGKTGRPRKVSVAVGNRSRIFKDLSNPNKAPIKYPLIVINRTGIERDASRVTDINENLKYMTGSVDPDDIAGNPINISFEVTVLAKKIDDIDRIIGNIIPWFNADIFVRIPHPKVSNKKINIQVLWAGSIDEELPKELEPDASDIKTATMNFTLKTWLFGGTQPWGGVGNVIESINFTLTDSLSSDSIYPNKVVGGFYEVPYTFDVDDYFDDVADETITDPSVDEFVVSGTVD